MAVKGLSELVAKLDRMARAAERPDLGQVGAYVVGAISDRCDAGRLPSGKAMKRYSTDYKAIRAAKGRSTSVVNLQMTGNMLGAMVWRVSGPRVSILFNNQADNDKALGNHKRRPFFELAPEDGARITEILGDKFK